MKRLLRIKPFPWFLGLFILLLVGVLQLHVSKPGVEILACPAACAAEAVTPAGQEILILSLNMLHGYPGFDFLESRVETLIDEIGRLEVDIVLLQEVPWTWSQGSVAQLFGEQLGFNYAYLRANGNYRLIGFEEGSVILSRYPLANLTFTELQPRAGFYENRVVLHATAETPEGPIDLFVTHLTNGRAAVNEAQAKSLLAFVQTEAKYPAIVAGDFNAVETSVQILWLTERWEDSFRTANPTSPGETCCVSDLSDLTSAPFPFERRVDYLFLVPGTKMAIRPVAVVRLFDMPYETAAGPLWLSDHAGLLATVVLEPHP